MKLEEIRKLIERATPGPWTSRTNEVFYPCHKSPSGYDRSLLEVDVCSGMVDDTATFIAASRTLMPQLLKIAEIAKRTIQNGGQMTDGNFACCPVDIAVLSSCIEVMEVDE